MSAKLAFYPSSGSGEAKINQPLFDPVKNIDKSQNQ